MKTIGGLNLYEIPDLSAALGIHPVTARRYLAEGRIPARKLGKSWLVPEDAFQAMFAHPAPARPAAGNRPRSKATAKARK
jgi:excisionase family DNA binding protein